MIRVSTFTFVFRVYQTRIHNVVALEGNRCVRSMNTFEISAIYRYITYLLFRHDEYILYKSHSMLQ